MKKYFFASVSAIALCLCLMLIHVLKEGVFNGNIAKGVFHLIGTVWAAFMFIVYLNFYLKEK